MPAVTYLSDQEVKNWQRVQDDKDCDDLLQELRQKTGENWVLEVRDIPLFRTGWERLWRMPNRTIKHYQLYADCHGEWQVINLVTPTGGSNFNLWEHSREATMNYIIGYLGGIYHANRPA